MKERIRNELLKKSSEAALAAVQIFNNPHITFKSESYIVLMIIAWTYLFHAYYHEKDIEYRYSEIKNKNLMFIKTKHGAFRHWDLEKCLRDKNSPIDEDTANNLKFLIGIRHEIEHQMTSQIDNSLSSFFQACCLNYNRYIKELFGEKYSIENHLAFSLQFSSISLGQHSQLKKHPDLPQNIENYLKEFDNNLSDEEFQSQKFAYRVFLIPKTANRIGQADEAIQLIPPDSPLAQNINAQPMLLKEIEKQKYLPTQIIEHIRGLGYQKFSMHEHICLWKEHDAKNPKRQYGIWVVNTWYWYETWLKFVSEHCEKNKSKYQ